MDPGIRLRLGLRFVRKKWGTRNSVAYSSLLTSSKAEIYCKWQNTLAYFARESAYRIEGFKSSVSLDKITFGRKSRHREKNLEKEDFVSV